MDSYSADIVSIAWLSLRVSLAATLFAAVVGIPLGTWLGLARFRGLGAVRVVVHTGMALPPVVVGLLVYLALSRTGPLGMLGWLYTPQAMVAAQTVLALPLVVGITMNAVAAVPSGLALQLRGLGATAGQVRRAVVREARSGVLLAVATALGRSLSEVGAVLMVGGNIAGHTRVLTTAVVLETGKGEFATALVLGGLLLALALAVNFAILRLQPRVAV